MKWVQSFSFTVSREVGHAIEIRFLLSIVGNRMKSLVEKTFLFDIDVVFIYIVVQMDINYIWRNNEYRTGDTGLPGDPYK